MDKMAMGPEKMDEMHGAPGGAPQTGGMMTPEEVRARVDEALPVPDEGYSVKKIQKVADAANDAMGAIFAEQKLPPIVVPPNPGKGDRWTGKLPAEVMVPVLLLADLAVSVGGEKGARYAVEPSSLVNDGALDLLSATLRALATDSAIRSAVAQEQGAMEKDDPTDEAEKPAMKAEMTPPKGAAAYM